MIKAQKVDKELMKKNNTKFIFSEIYKQGQISRSGIADLTKMSVMSAGRIADQLIESGLVEEFEFNNDNAPGRPPKLLQVAVDNLLCVGVFLDKTGMQIGIVNPYGKIICKEFIACMPNEQNAEECIKMLGAHIKDFISRQAPLKVLRAVGISLPGVVDVEKGKLNFSSQLKWSNIRVASLFKKAIGCESVLVENDIKAVALAESHFGASVGYNNCIELNIGSGIGTAAILNGEIYRGKSNMAGEIGHIIINPNGKMCECGKRGCLQTNISDWAILQEARAVKPGIELDEIFEAYQRKEAWAEMLLRHVGDYLSITINILINTYSPEVVVLCGSLIEEYAFFRSFIMDNYKNQLNGYMDKTFALKVSKFGADGKIIGAANLAFMYTLDKWI